MGKSNIIEINGKRYDARTGALLAASAGSAQHTQSQQHMARVIQPTAQAPKTTNTSAPKPLSAQSELDPRATKPKPKVRVHDAIKASKQLSHRKTQPSKTLMRAAVSKPKPALKRHSKAHGHTDSLVEKPAARLQTKPSVRRIDDKRLRRAQTTPKTQAVKRFSEVTGPAPQPPTQIAPPAAKPHVNLPHGPRPAHAHGKAPKHPRTTADILEQALQSAVSHQEIFEGSKKRRPGKLASIGMVAAALTILGGFVAYHNVNDVKLHLASSKAGFTANLPDYQPAGYHLNHLKSAPGEVAINFRSNSDDRSYAVIEKPSAWNSEALRDSFLASAGHSYQTVDAAGRTLFLYGDNAATWVSGGIWYQVQSNGTLSNRQLIELATSM